MRHLARALATGAIAAATFLTVRSAPAGTVNGTLVLPPKGKRVSPPTLSRGFVQRVPHPLMANKPSEDPLPAMFVFLTGVEPGEEGSKLPRRPAEVELIGERFARAVFPVMVGQMVLVRNVSTKSSTRGVSPRIDAPGNRDIFTNPADAGNPLNPKGERELALKTALVPVELRAVDSAHLKTTLVGLPSNFFTVPNGSGDFEIDGLPPGKWTARVWYQNGWLKGADTEVEVPERGKKAIKITIPPDMTVVPATGN